MSHFHFQKIKEDLNQMGINEGDDILIHASFKSMGEIDGGIKTFIEAVLSRLGDKGTLLIPALSYKTVTIENPVFDRNHTPSCVGSVTEFFRKYEGVKRSMHPSHSVCAYGYRQEEYIENHELDNTPVGINSPFYRLPDYHGKILMIGCGLKPNTSMHGVEEKNQVPYVLNKDTTPCTLIDGEKVIVQDHYRHHIAQNGFKQRYDRLCNLMEIKEGMLLAADCFLIDADKMWQLAGTMLKENPYYFVEKI